MNTDNLGVSGPGVGGPIDPYSHHHLTQHHHLLPPHHSQHPSSMYCSSSNPYAELFLSPFRRILPHLMILVQIQVYQLIILRYKILLIMLFHIINIINHQQQPQHHHHHQISSSSNGERTPSSDWYWY